MREKSVPSEVRKLSHQPPLRSTTNPLTPTPTPSTQLEVWWAPLGQAQMEARGLAPLHWADDDGNPTEQYPLNPNGSPGGVAGICSPDGRHLALMPHPERSVRPWQWAWRPPPFDTLTTSPWLQLFINARNWTQECSC